MRKILLSALVSFGAITSALAEDGLRSVFVEPKSFNDYIKEHEVISDLQFFVDRGYLLPAWKPFHLLHERVRVEVVNPDYEKRTGLVAPDDGSFELDFVEFTDGPSPDLFVMSRLPGDCLPEGCLYQVYRLAGDEWFKAFEGHSRSFVYRKAGLNEPEIVQVGDQDTPTRIHRWTGYGFMERVD